MAVFAKGFGADLDEWVKKSDERMLAVWREATQRTVSLAQARIPVNTGYARASVRASLQSMPPIDPNSRGVADISYSYNDEPVVLTISRAKLGQTIYIGWTASYVQFLEYGHSKQAPSGFLGLAAQQWDHTVEQVTQELKRGR